MRNIDPALLAAMEAAVWHPTMLLDLDWPAGRIRAHSGTGTVTISGEDYVGVGRFGQVGAPGEAFGLAAQPVDLALFGLPADVLDEITSAPFRISARNRRGTLYVGATTQAGGNVLIGAPYALVTGYVDAVRYTLRRDGEERQHGVQVSLGVGPSARAAAVVAHSAEDQQSRHPFDTAGRWLVEARKRIEVMTWPQS